MRVLALCRPLRLASPVPRAAHLAPRAYSTRPLAAPAVYASASHDPWFNLAFEDHLLRSTPAHQPLLFTYRNDPCVVVGRNQNPWKEANPRALAERGLPLVRRRSGGGTVYHDLGNTNFSIMLPRESFTRAGGALLVAAAVRERLGVPACTVNDRNDVIIREAGGPELKVSGSAYKIISHRAYHHGTMLISSDLSSLGRALHSASPHMETKGVASVRAPVSTINKHRAAQAREITHDDFVAAVQAEFRAVYGAPEGEVVVVREEDVTERKVWDGVEDLKSWEWQIGQTPEFTNRLSAPLSFGTVSAFVHSRHALITSLLLELAPGSGSGGEAGEAATQAALDAVALGLEGTRYATLDGAEGRVAAGVNAEVVHEVLEWLREDM